MKATIEFEPTPEQLAEALDDMDQDEQARFFDALAGVMEGWPDGGAGLQSMRIAEALGKLGSERARWMIERLHGDLKSYDDLFLEAHRVQQEELRNREIPLDRDRADSVAGEIAKGGDG